MFDLDAIQAALRQFGFDGWLLYDFRGLNVLAHRVLRLQPESVGSRRFAYCIPAQGEPKKLVHRIESGALDHLPGETTVYLRWQEFEAGLAHLLHGLRAVAMEYSERNGNPYVSRVDAGTVEIVRGCGVEIGSSGNLIQLFEATLSPRQQQLHHEAAVHTDIAFTKAWDAIRERCAGGGEISESEVRSVIMDHFTEHGLTTYHPPIVAVDAHSGQPHYETGTGEDTAIRAGRFVLIDLWARHNEPDGVYSDLTRVGFVGETVPDRHREIFHIVAAARDAAIERVRSAFASGKQLRGAEVDDACRAVIEQAGYGSAFVHRTGHSIGREVHGNGANMDNLETRDDRLVLPSTLFSVEPGIYLPEFGVRSEINVLIEADGTVRVTGGVGGGDPQSEVLAILAE
jgi:Xaa-Pro aminopeptidase